MSPRRSCGLLVVMACAAGLVIAAPVRADAQHAPPIAAPAVVSGSLLTLLSTSDPFARRPLPQIDVVAPMPDFRVERTVLRRPAALPPLYVSFAALQALDVHSTMTAVGGGRAEANPAMRGLVREPAAFLAAKVAATAATFYISERLWRRSRVGAVVLMVAVNGAYVAIVARNYRQ